MTTTKLIEELLDYAGLKKGTELGYRTARLSRLSWGDFFDVHGDDDGEYAHLPVMRSRLNELRKQFPGIKNSKYQERDGHVYMLVPLDGSISIPVLKTLIDDAYEIVWQKLDDDGVFWIDCATGSYNEKELLDLFIDRYNLTGHRDTILNKLARNAILLKTKKAEAADIPIGATKFGGSPDLPDDAKWPILNQGTALAFLCQINLAEVAQLGTVLDGFPKEGLLSVFSSDGCFEEDQSEPISYRTDDIPHVILLTKSGRSLTRRQLPESLRLFRPIDDASIDFQGLISLPKHRAEPAMANLGWSKEVYERFDTMEGKFRSVQMYRAFRDSSSSHHQLGGYADFQQMFPEELNGVDSSLLLQLGTDFSWCQIEWGGDGGEFALYVDNKALKKGRFEQVVAFRQGG